MIQNEYCIELLVGCTAYMCLWNRWCAMEDEKWMLGEALKSLFPVSSISGPAMQVHCVRSNATQGNTSIYFKQASDLTKNLSNFIKMCSFYFKITSKLLFSMKTGKVWRKNLVQKIWQIWGLTTSKITYSLYPKVLMDGSLKQGCSTGETNMNGGSDCISNQARLYTD